MSSALSRRDNSAETHPCLMRRCRNFMRELRNRAFLTGEGIEVDAIAPQVQGKFMSASG
jgi:hypothetical protein